jgi:hypothetical protein
MIAPVPPANASTPASPSTVTSVPSFQGMIPFKVRIEITETDFDPPPSDTDTTGLISSIVTPPPTTLASSLPPLASPPDEPVLKPTPSATPIGPPMDSTEEPLKPIPPATTAAGSPNGHHEITEPNLTATAPCRGCSPVIEISVTGWDTSPAADHAGTSSSSPPKATITAGNSGVVVSEAPSGGGIVIGGTTTVKPGQTITISNTPVIVQTSAGKTHVIVGTNTVPIVPSRPDTHQPGSPQSQITVAPLVPILSPLVIAGETITPNAAYEYIIGIKTLVPGGPAITVSGTTLSLLPSATAVVINGKTTHIAQFYGAYGTTTIAPLLTWKDRVYTPNVAGYYRLGPGTTLIPGGPPVTVSGTTISLDYGGTAVVFAGSTSFMTPTTTVITYTLPTAPGAGASNGGLGGGLAQSTGKHNSAGPSLGSVGFSGILEGFFLLGVMSVGWLAVWL